MRSSWQKVVDSVLRPSRPLLGWCLAERESHLARRRPFAEARARALRNCELRIEQSRAAVFAANDGVIPASMTDLEREWRKLHRPDEGGLMELWARIAPASWIDRKRWRDSEPALQLDAAVALAADAVGVEAAESAIESLRTALAPWGVRIGARVRFRMLSRDCEHSAPLLSEPLRVALAAGVRLEHARDIEREVHDAILLRFPDRPLLARDIAHAAFVDCAWNAAELGDASPVEPLRALWTTGYALTALDASGVTLELPR